VEVPKAAEEAAGNMVLCPKAGLEVAPKAAALDAAPKGEGAVVPKGEVLAASTKRARC
jgi:hypothetical protein